MQPTQNEDINHYEIKLFLCIYKKSEKIHHCLVLLSHDSG